MDGFLVMLTPEPSLPRIARVRLCATLELALEVAGDPELQASPEFKAEMARFGMPSFEPHIVEFRGGKRAESYRVTVQGDGTRQAELIGAG